MSHSRRSSGSRGHALGEGSSGAADNRQRAYLVPKTDGGGFDVQPSDHILAVSRNSYHSRMTDLWEHWDKIPLYIRDAVFADLQASFIIDPEDLVLFRTHWERKMRKNYRGALAKMKDAGKKPSWMSENLFARFVEYWENEEVKAVAARNSANRLSNPSTHRAGSKSFQQHREEMTRLNAGAPPSHLDVFTRTHAVEKTDADGTVTYEWSDAKSASIKERCEDEIARVLAQTCRVELAVEEKDRIFAAITDPPTRNRQYGYGNQAAATRQAAYNKQQAEETIASLQAQVAELNDWRKTALKQQLEEAIAAYLAEHGPNMPPSQGSSSNDGWGSW